MEIFVKILKILLLTTILLRAIQAARTAGVPRRREQHAKSEEIRKYMNVSVNPCDDFYEFVCGNFEKYNPTEIRVDIFSILEQEYDREVLSTLTRESAHDTEMERNVRNFYESCLKIDAAHFNDKLKDVIKEFGEMPALVGNKWQENNFDWLKTIGEISHRYDKQLILRYEILREDANVKYLKIAMEDVKESLAATIIRSKHGISEEMVVASKLKMYLGLEPNLALTTAKEIVEFKQNLASACSADGDTAGESTTLDKMQRKYLPDLDIKRFVNISLGSLVTTQVVDQLAPCQPSLVNVLKSTPKRIVANYIFYYMLKDFMLVHVPNHMQELCKIETTNHFANEMDFMAYRKDMSKQMENDIKEFWFTIKLTFQAILQSPRLSWIGHSTRNKALDKLKAMKLEFGQYERENFSEKFRQLRLNKNDFIGNLKAILAFKSHTKRLKLNQPLHQREMAEKEGTPFTSRLQNSVIFPVSSLQPHYLWSERSPNALKFATLGFLASHELVHGFDDKGVFYNNQGKFKRWWDNRSILHLYSRLECFTDQYKQYNYRGESQSENIADNGGLRLAYEAYIKWYEDKLRFHLPVGDETLPGLNYTNKQLFFIGYGQLFCSNTHADLSYSLDTSSFGHVPNKYRVNGPLSNLEEFSKEFNCRKGSAMNPSRKCVLY